MSIEVRQLTKKFGDFTALNKLDLVVPSGELVALLGPSGSGKTTLLRIIAGLEFQDEGAVLFEGVDAKDRHAKDRRVGFVFQHYALFRHMTVFENVAFGLRVKPKAIRPSKKEITEKVHKLLNLVQLDRLSKRFPSQLSGGQKQRVALARALAVEPKVMLLDEPFGALDAKVRKELRLWLRRLHDEIHVTSIFVTHDQEEALEVADRVVVMKEGEIVQVGTPQEIYHHPASPFVYNFLGDVNLFRCRVEGGKAYIGKMTLDISNPAQHDKEGSAVFVRPHTLDISRRPTDGNHFEARVLHVNPAGYMVKVELISEWGDPVHVEITQERYRELNLKKDDSVFVSPSGQQTEDKKPVYEVSSSFSNIATEVDGFTVWMTGLSGAGKSRLAFALKRKLAGLGAKVELVDGNVIRTNLSEGLGYSREDRETNIRRIGFLCHLLGRNGVITIVSALSPYRASREQVRHLVGRFVEVFVKCPIEDCEMRDETGLYKKAREGKIKGFPGVDEPYEEPLHPEVVFETLKESVEEGADRILRYLQDAKFISDTTR
ncbi:MAG: adenylyl-sulfate kinase [Candidatus Omnitrophota bacterium]